MAGALVWLQSHWRAHYKERQAIPFLTNLNELGMYAGGYKSEENHAPAWLQRLVGPGYFLTSFIKFPEVDIYNPGKLDSQQIETIILHLSYMKHLQGVYIRNPKEFAESTAELRAAIRAKLPHCQIEGD